MTQRKSATAAALAALFALLSGLGLFGCASSHGNCANVCVRQASFDFAVPPAGTVFDLTLQPGNISVHCSATAPGNASCDSPGPLSVVSFGGANGNELQKLIWTEPPAGTLMLSLKVDGVDLVNQDFEYTPKPTTGTCGSGCYEDPHFVVQ